MTTKIQVAFALGVMAAEHIHGTNRKLNQVRTDAIFRVLEQLATGELTLLDTPEETIADLPAPSPELAAKAPEAVSHFRTQMAARMPAMIRQAMRDQREVAAELLKAMT
ncbi:MAG: hypothetical protein IAG10_08470 [Planctomycetaceae bacterium]|nr:hypothetical protein [Planctomycetaceae bacterium]